MKVPAYLNQDMINYLTSDCEGAWLEVDTAKHVGFGISHKLTQRDLKRHILLCEACQNTILMEGVFSES